MGLLERIPYYNKPEIRKRADELFSRQMLGAVLVGKFVGDYAAILTTHSLGVHVGYIVGIIGTIGLFIYWDKVARKAKQKKEQLSNDQTQIDEY